MTFGEKVIAFHEQLIYTGNPLPKGVRVMNPFIESPEALDNIRLFAKEYLNDNEQRHIILGINLSRFGFYINSPFPLAITQLNDEGKETNCNYYDSQALTRSVRSFMIKSLKQLVGLGAKRDVCFCLGIGKNARFLNSINEQYKFFQKIIPLEHPRFIMQYKSAEKELFIDKCLSVLLWCGLLIKNK